MIRFLVTAVVFAVFYAVGNLVFGINPTWQEIILIISACAVADMIEEVIG